MRFILLWGVALCSASAAIGCTLTDASIRIEAFAQPCGVVGAGPALLQGNATIAPKPGESSTLDLGFLAVNLYTLAPGKSIRQSHDYISQYVFHSPVTAGATVFLRDVTISQMRLSSSPFFLPGPFQLSETSQAARLQLFLENLSVTTTCDNVMQLRAAAMQLGVTVSYCHLWHANSSMTNPIVRQMSSQTMPEKLVISSFRVGPVQAQNVTVSCVVPAQQDTNDGTTVYAVDDAIGLVNAIVAAQKFTPSLGLNGITVFLRNNISFGQLFQPNITRTPQLMVAINVTVIGAAGRGRDGTVVDWNLMNWVMSVNDPSVHITFTNMTMMNLCALRGLFAPNIGYFGLFATPFWAIWEATGH